MSQHSWYHSRGLLAFRKPLVIRRRPRGSRRAAALPLFLLFAASLAYGAPPIASPKAPLPPQIPPIISGEYSTDLDGNRINDVLDGGLGTPGDLSIASVGGGMLAVELVFSEPVTQGQIDDFLRLGGQITYIYQAISYGWNGLIPHEKIRLLPSAMGSALVQVEAEQQLVLYMDTATQTGRVRPIWKAGYAGSPTGLSGDPNTTIAFVGGGVDAKHKDLKGRYVYWRDFSDDNEPTPVDFDGHETLVAGVALGTGDSSGADAGTLRYTYVETYPYDLHMDNPISLPGTQVIVTTTASWSGQDTGIVGLYAWGRGTTGNTRIVNDNYKEGPSPVVVSTLFTPNAGDCFAPFLLNRLGKNLENVVMLTSVSPYPGVGDGFNKLRGVAPGCMWAAAKVQRRDRYASASKFTAALDDLILHRVEKKIKVINISAGLADSLGYPSESVSLRDKVNSIVKNGVVVVAAVGNNAAAPTEAWRKMADPARAAQVITVGASNDENVMTYYSSYGFFSPRTNSGEDFKPDVLAPGGSFYYSGIMSVDSGSSDGINADKQPDDYTVAVGTSFSAPFVAGSAALVIQAMEQRGARWDFNSPALPHYVKMLLCATASETNAKREGPDKNMNPTLERAAGGPNAFPLGKDQHEGYGLINPDAAVEAVQQVYTLGATGSLALGGNAFAKRVWARTVNLKAGFDVDFTLDNSAGADCDLYLYSATPSDNGTPVILASSTKAGVGTGETLHYAASADTMALLVIKRVAGSGTVTLRSVQAGPPTALDVQATCALNGSTTITLKATDDGRPTPPGAITYTIVSLPAHATLEIPGGAAIAAVPAKLPADKVVYKPAADWLGDDSFTFLADDGGTAPFGGPSNTATVKVTVLKEITIECPVLGSADDVNTNQYTTAEQTLTGQYLYAGLRSVGLRFRNVKIPKGAVIKRATLKVSCISDFWGTAAVNGVLKGEAADNPGPFEVANRLVTMLPTTKAATDWKLTAENPWKKNTWYESPDLTPIVQEIVNRAKWASDNALVILYLTNESSEGDRAFWSYDGNPALAARLVITYQP